MQFSRKISLINVSRLIFKKGSSLLLLFFVKGKVLLELLEKAAHHSYAQMMCGGLFLPGISSMQPISSATDRPLDSAADPPVQDCSEW